MRYDSTKLYIVIDEEYRDSFEDKVVEFLNKGYLLLGGVSTYVNEDGAIHYCQALLKSSDKKSL